MISTIHYLLKSCVIQIGELKKGLNPPSVTDLVLVSPYMGAAIKTGLITGIIALAVSRVPRLSISFPMAHDWMDEQTYLNSNQITTLADFLLKENIRKSDRVKQYKFFGLLICLSLPKVEI